MQNIKQLTLKTKTKIVKRRREQTPKINRR
jgi:hypothetical protein